MKRCISQLTGLNVRARDGNVGNVNDFYFDDESWCIRYVVINTGVWSSCRKVMISPMVLDAPVWSSCTFPAKLTMEQIRNSPGISAYTPGHVPHEAIDIDHYSWPAYSLKNTYTTARVGLLSAYLAKICSSIMGTQISVNPPAGNRGVTAHLRSTCSVKGYSIQGNDGEIGHVEDYIIEDETWSICQLVVDTGKWFSGRKIFIDPKWIKKER